MSIDKKPDHLDQKSNTFEGNLEFINKEISKRKSKWTLSILPWFDFDDVSQILRIHLCKKWHLYDPQRPLGPWVNRAISNQIKNIIRNNYGNYCRPCLKCEAAEGEDGCKIYEKQCSNCPAFSNWEKSKKNAYETKLPVSLELHSQEVFDKPQEAIDVEKTAQNIHAKMKTVLKASEYKVYEYLYIHHKTEDETAKLMGYKTTEKGRSPGYKQLKNIQKKIIDKVKKCLKDGEIDIV